MNSLKIKALALSLCLGASYGAVAAGVAVVQCTTLQDSNNIVVTAFSAPGLGLTDNMGCADALNKLEDQGYRVSNVTPVASSVIYTIAQLQ